MKINFVSLLQAAVIFQSSSGLDYKFQEIGCTSSNRTLAHFESCTVADAGSSLNIILNVTEPLNNLTVRFDVEFWLQFLTVFNTTARDDPFHQSGHRV
jgi:hypothetical protein